MGVKKAYSMQVAPNVYKKTDTKLCPSVFARKSRGIESRASKSARKSRGIENREFDACYA